MAYKTCVTLAEPSPTKLNKLLQASLKRSDYIEIRFDFMEPNKVPIALSLVRKHMPRCICTLRPRSEGGKFSSSEKNRISILKLISEYNPYLLDVEYHTIRKNKSLQQYSKNVKIVTTAKSIKDTLCILSLYKFQNNTNLIAFAMGDYGRMSRILCTQLGSPYTYVSLGKPIAPGQFSLDEIKSIFELKQ